MGVLAAVLQIVFGLIMSILLILFGFFLLTAWSWAQHQTENDSEPHPKWVDIISLAAVEWGAFLTLLAFHGRRLENIWEASQFAPRDWEQRIPSTQLPIVLVPSPLWSSSLYRLLFYRLRAHYYKSIWPFSFKSFVRDQSLLQYDLEVFLKEVMAKTGSLKLTVISFGSSRPLVARALASKELASLDVQWIAISAPSKLSAPHKLLRWPSIHSIYSNAGDEVRAPDILIRGERDSLTYSRDNVWGQPLRTEIIQDVGHYGALLHSKAVQQILAVLESSGGGNRRL